jgi:intracellular septation protein
MQLLFDFLPILVFFIAYKLGGIYVATAAIMGAMVVQVSVQWLRHRKVSPMMLLSLVLVLIFGGVTLLVHDKAFIQWKLTVLDWLFALGFLLAPYFGGQTLVQRLMGGQINLPERHWRTLNWMWIIFFTFIGALNVYVIYHFDEATWVNFKMFGTTGLTLVFVVVQGLWLAGKMPKEGEPAATPAEQQREQQN